MLNFFLLVVFAKILAHPHNVVIITQLLELEFYLKINKLLNVAGPQSHYTIENITGAPTF